MNGVRPPDSQHSAELPDGRWLAWSEWGPPDGDAVVFCTGAAMSGALGFGTDALEALGLRLLGLDRPGLGRSSPHPGKTLATWVDDVRSLVAQRGLRHVSAVGFSQGAPFAVALGGAGVAEAVAVVAGQDDLRSMRGHLREEVAEMVAALDADPSGFERRVAASATAPGLWDLITGMSGPHDLAWYTSPAFRPAFRRSLEEGFGQGAAGYARDLVNALGPWPWPAESIRVPVDLWYGRLDTSPVHSPDFGQTLARRLPRATLHLYSKEGGSILWTRGPEILAALRGNTRAGR